MRTPASASVSDVKAQYDAKAPSYESNRLAPWYKAQNRLVLKHVAGVRGTVLDVGCGTGWFLRRLVGAHADASGIGVDLSPRMVKVAGAYATDEGVSGLEFICGDWEAPDTREQVSRRIPEGASLVVCVSAFHYFRRPELSLRMMREALAPGGRLLLLDRATDGSPGTVLWDLLHRYVIHDHVRFYKVAEMKSLLRDSGFADVEVLDRFRRLFWHGKLHTSLVLLAAGADRD